MIAALMWMGTLTFTFMATEQVQITNVQFGGADVNKYVVIMARNTGTDTITISEVQINGVKQNMITPPLPQTISANAELALNVTYTWITGCNYDFKLLTSKGNQFQYMASAPAI
jgi:homoserine dehydrogenase